MNQVIDKKLISHLLLLEDDQQEKALRYIKSLLDESEMTKRAKESEEAITQGKTKTLKQFNLDFEQWKIQKRGTM